MTSPNETLSSSSTNNTATSRVIATSWPVYITGNKCLLWSIQAAVDLRQQHRIVGESAPLTIQPSESNLQHINDNDEQPNSFCISLPIYLSLQQTQLLLGKNLIHLVDGNNICLLRASRFAHLAQQTHSRQERITWLKRQQSIIEQQQQSHEINENNKRQRYSETPEATEKRRKRIKQPIQETGNDNSTQITAASSNINNTLHPASTLAIATSIMPQLVPSLPALTEICHNTPASNSSTTRMIEDDDVSAADQLLIPLLSAAQLSSPSCFSLSSAFSHLYHSEVQNRPVFISQASQYGGDYLLYSGDPADYHAHTIVKVIEKKNQTQQEAEQSGESAGISVRELLRLARIGNNVKKGVVIAEVELSDQLIHSQSPSSSAASMTCLTVSWESQLSKRSSQ